MRISTAFQALKSLTGILDQQSRLSQVQEQLSSGKRILKPSDDPTGTAQILRLKQAISQTDQYQRNADNSLNRLNLEEATLDNAQDSLLRIREIAIQGGNATLSDTDRAALAQEVRERLNELLSLANTKDSNQEYLFAGYKVTTEPFSKTSNGSYIYNGDQGQRSLQISSGRQIADSDSGNDVFVDIKNGNGTFQITANGANTGSGIFDVGDLVDSTAYVADTYTITFVTNGNGNLGYNVVGATSGQLIPPLPNNPVTNAPDYVDGATFQFNGMQTGFTGTPAVGDTFTVTPSSKQDIFSTVDKLAAALETKVTSPKIRSDIFNSINQSISEIDLAFDNITQIRTNIGARLKTIDDQKNVNDSFKLEMQQTLSTVNDLDYTEAIINLQTRLTALEAAQSSYTRIQGLSLFDHL